MNTSPIVWITGASSGIGRDLALEYAKAGWHVYASARNVEALALLSNEAKAYEGRIIEAAMDVTDSQEIADFVEQRIATSTIPTLAVFNAGFYEPIGLDDFSFDNFKTTFDVNVFGVARCISSLLPHYVKARSGHLAIVSSVAGYTGLPRAAAYGSSKAALIHLCESLKCECDAAGITLSMINPGFVRTPLTDKNDFPMPMVITAEAAAAYFIHAQS